MIWLSLFDGMSCGQMAIEKLGLKVSKYYASEVDKHAIKMTKHLFPNTIHVGSVVDVDVSKLDKIDVLIGGSPCQSFSFAGKRKGMSTKENEEIYNLERYLELKEQGFEFEGQSYLFWEYMRVLEDIRRINPNVLFLLENVEMGEKWEKVLTKAIGIKGIHINSNLVSAQNRKRIYWTNIGMKPMGLFGDMQSTIEQPKDKGIFLKDILESDVDEKYYLSDDKIKPLFKGLDVNSKINTIRTGGKCSQSDKHNWDLVKINKNGNVKRDQDKASCFTAGGNSGGNHSDMDLLVFGCDYRGDEGIRVKEDGKSGTLCARARTDESCGQLAKIGYRIRRLTPRECARLQTVSEDKIDLMLSSGVSDSQIYKMLGNGWTIEVICHIMNYINIS